MSDDGQYMTPPESLPASLARWGLTRGLLERYARWYIADTKPDPEEAP